MLGALDLLCESCQVGDLDAEGGGDPSDGAPGWISPGLNVAEPCRVEISTMGDLLLTEAASGPGLPDCLAEGELGLCAWGHARNRCGQSRL